MDNFPELASRSKTGETRRVGRGAARERACIFMSTKRLGRMVGSEFVSIGTRSESVRDWQSDSEWMSMQAADPWNVSGICA